MDIQKIIIGLSLALIILITGCRGGGETGGIEQKEIYKGTGAVEVTLVRETVPDYPVTPPYNLLLSADLVNKGAHEITAGMVIVEGLPEISPQSFQATGRTQYQEEGYPVRINFNQVRIDSNKQFLVTACYPYKTWLKGTFCYDPNMQPTTLAKACTFKEHHELPDGQGSPIAITDLDIRRKGTGDEAEIVLRIKNMGRGEVRSPDNPTIDCQGQTVGYESRDKIRINRIMFNNQDIGSQCTPQPQAGLVNLYNGEVILTCRTQGLTGAGRAELKPFEIDIDYGYVTQSAIANINVQPTFT
jgi:hypothetical protein